MQVYLPSDYNKADTIFTSLSNSCANAVSREGHDNKASKHHSYLNNKKLQALEGVTHNVDGNPGVLE